MKRRELKPITKLRPDIRKFILEEFAMGRSVREIRKAIKSVFGEAPCEYTINRVIEEDIQLVRDLEERFVEQEMKDLAKMLVKNKIDKLKIVNKNIEHLIDLLNQYRVKIEKWMKKLDADLDRIYKETQDEITLGKINKIKESLHKDLELLNSLTAGFSKFWDMHMRILELTKPTQVRIDRMDVEFKITNIIQEIAQKGYFVVKVLDPMVKHKLRELEEIKKIAIYKSKV